MPINPGKKSNDTSVIIVNFNSGQLLSLCLESLIKTSSYRDIIVIDNFSTDGSIHSSKSLPNVHIIQNTKNLGFAKACNIGIEAASGRHLLFLNPDSTVHPDTLIKLKEVLISDPKVGMVGGLLLNIDGSEQEGGRRAHPTPWRAFTRALGLHRLENLHPTLFFDFHLNYQPLPNKPMEVEAISGACMLVKRAAIDDVGYWDEGYFLHCEDLDWCMRFHQKGWKIMFVPDARVTHVGGACSKSRPIFVEWHKHRGMQRFYRKFYKDKYPLLLWPVIVVAIWFRFSAIACYSSIRRVLDMMGFARA